MKNLFYSIFVSCLLSIVSSVNYASEYVVIVHPSNSAAITEKDVSRLFLGKVKRFSDGKEAIPINSLEGSPSRKAFNTKVIGKTADQIKAYWTRLIFTGKGMAPKEVKNDQEMLELVQTNPSMIGYVSRNSVNDSVKVLFNID